MASTAENQLVEDEAVELGPGADSSIVRRESQRVEVFTRPEGDGHGAGYRDTVSFGEGEDLPLTLDGQGFRKIAVKNIHPSLI
jgi:hypothetical protein